MKIVIATSVYYPQINGVAVFSHNLAVGLARRGNEVLVITPSQTKKSHTEIADGVKVCYLKSSTIKVYPDQIHPVEKEKQLFGKKMPKLLYKHGFKASIFPAKEIKKCLLDFQPDVIHVQGSDPIGISVVRYAHKAGIPVVLTEHNQPEVLTDSLPIPGVIKKPANKALSAYFVNRQRKVDYVTMPTSSSIEKLIRGRDIGVPVVAVSNGVDLTEFQPGEVHDKLYTKYDIPKNVPIVLYIGRLDPEKNVKSVLVAFKKFLQIANDNNIDKLSKTLFLVVGDGVDRERLVLESERLGISESVKFLGRVMPPDLYNIYRMGDVFITASEIETQGIVLIEAAATGLPLIAVNAGAVAEVCLNGINGFLLEPGDEDGMANSLFTILSDEKLLKQMSKKSLEVAESHSLERTLDKFLEIYQEVIAKNKTV